MEEPGRKEVVQRGRWRIRMEGGETSGVRKGYATYATEGIR